MHPVTKGTNKLLGVVGSAKLALVLVIVFIILATVGAVVPQKTLMGKTDFAFWQEQHPEATRILDSVGFFNVFLSWPFLITLFLLAVNTLVCTIVHFVSEGGFASYKGPGAVRRVSFMILHISLLAIMAGGLLSAGGRFGAALQLTEGQGLKDSEQNYTLIAKGRFCVKADKDDVVMLEKVKADYKLNKYQSDLSAGLAFYQGHEKIDGKTIKINRPYTFKGLSYTLNKNGFSPRISIRKEGSNQILANSFVALSTFELPEGKKYHDFIPLPFFTNRVYVTIYPSYDRQGDKVIKTKDSLDNPLMIVEIADNDDNIIETADMVIGDSVTLGGYTFGFEELRQWASFKVGLDPGYPLMCWALWLGVGALLMRYTPEMYHWLKENNSNSH